MVVFAPLFIYSPSWHVVFMEIIQPVADAFMSAVAIGTLVLSAMLFAVMMARLVKDLIDP